MGNRPEKVEKFCIIQVTESQSPLHVVFLTGAFHFRRYSASGRFSTERRRFNTRLNFQFNSWEMVVASDRNKSSMSAYTFSNRNEDDNLVIGRGESSIETEKFEKFGIKQV